MNKLKQKFIEEAESLLTNLDNILIDLEKSNSSELVNEVFRVMHTIKGTSGMFGFERIVEITHEAESIYDLVRNGKLNLSPELLEVTFSIADHIRALLSDESFTNEDNIKRHEILNSTIQVIKGSNDETQVKSKTEEEKGSNNIRTWSILFYPSEDLIKRCINILYIMQDLAALGEFKISSYTSGQSIIEFWHIFLVTEKPYEEIENALMFVMDYCKIAEIAKFNIFDAESLANRTEIQNPSEKMEPEIAELSEIPVIKPAYSINSNLQSLTESKIASVQGSGKTASARINVEVAKLDSLMYLVSELVTSKSELLIGIQRHNDEKIANAAEKIDKLSKLFGDNALNIRLVSLHEMLDKFKRLIRDLAKQLGKSIDFVIVGEDTELDKSIIDAIGEPIMHLLRNNIDHGIELPETRLAMGKPENGTVRFEAEKTGNNVFITISDDGKGIDTSYIYNKAVEKGFVTAGTQLTQKEILDLIFLPGFSTAQNLSDVSGRGVGMDIVQKKIKEIRGEVSISSEVGQGTSFKIKLQQTISIIDTLLIGADKTIYAVPVEDIEACLLEAHENIANRQNNLIEFDNELIPFVNLNNPLLCKERTSENEKLIIIKKQNRRYAVVCEAILGEFQAVIKPLGKSFSNVRFLSGASLLGDGSIALLLDTDKLWYETALNKV